MKGQREIIVCFGIARLKAYGFRKLFFGRANVTRLQENQSEIIMGFREIWIASQEFPEDIRSASKIVLLIEHQSQLHAGVDVLGFQADGFIQLASGFGQTT